MLDALRKASERWFGRALMAIVLAFIVFSFVIWGIGDIFRGFGSDKLATVGNRVVTTEQFRTAYERELNQLQQQQRRSITTEEAHAMGLDSQVLSGLIADAVLDSQAQQLGLAIGDKQVTQSIVNDPTFKGANGQFDPNAFANLLQQNGLTEAQFVAEQRGLDLRREIAGAIIGDLPTPRPMLDAVDQFRNETRSVDYFVLPTSAAGTIPAPSEKDLQAWFDERRAQWRAPEYRSLVVLAVTPASVADPKDVSDAEARAYYESHRADYGEPERRQLQQATFPSQQQAEAAIAKAKGGGDFAAVAKDQKGSLVDLGTVEKSSIFDPAVAQAAFSVPEGGFSAPVKGPFGWVVVKAVKVQPATIKSFEQEAASIKSSLAMQKASAKVSNLRDRIEDQRTSGKTLTQAAQSVGLKAQMVGAVDAQGLDKNGKPVPLPDKSDLLKAAFASDVGMDNDIISTPDGGDLWFEVANVDPAHDRTLAEVKPEAIAAWRQDQISQRLAQKARDLVQKIDGGEALAAVAKTYGAQVRTVNDVKRIGTTDMPAPVVAEVFNTPVHGAGSAAPDPQTRTLFQVNDSVTPPVDPDSQVNRAIADNLTQQMGDDILSEYLNALQAIYGVSVNQAAIASVTSGESQP